MPYRMTPSVRHRAIEVHYYYIIIIIFNSTGPNCFKLQAADIGPKMSKIYDGDEKTSKV